MAINNSNLINKSLKICITGGSGFIGSNLIRILKNTYDNVKIINIDKLIPKEDNQKCFWQKCDINNEKLLKEIICDFKPNHVIHLAADVTMNGKSLDDYKTNLKGVEIIINSVRSLPVESTLIVASSQHVKKPGSFMYSSSNDYDPLGLYGKSKVITEELIIKSNLKQNWFIVRPTLIWGPGNLIMAKNIFNYMDKNIYYHPQIDNVVRSYGYIDNVCNQIINLCSLNADKFQNRIFYLADGNLLQKEWICLANKFMGNHHLKTLPNSLFRNFSYLGEYLKKVYPNFPIYRERYLNLTTSNPVPLDKTFFYLGTPKISLDKAMLNTTSWVKSYLREI